ncbi:hypothetical protein NBRC116592_17130 [Colwellia sp. KU-HH00111]|uniref:hypothetical protein n=1 Tax=Colwellia sp. KU-HH00111 TaxID=3127652 RepID=UPI0031066A30
MKEIKNIKTVKVEISEGLLTKLAWAFPAGNVEQRVEFCLRMVVEESEKVEGGVRYPEDRLPCKSFEHVRTLNKQ